MRNMSFSLTTEQMRARTKFVTRRIGWGDLKPGDRVQAVVKGMGLKKGEQIERIAVIVVVANIPQPLNAITQSDCLLEGFPDLEKKAFIDLFRLHNKCDAGQIVNRISFYFEEGACKCPQCREDQMYFHQDGEVICDFCGWPFEDESGEEIE